ncbi:GAP family protein [Agromyces sp. SYSU K20354]|uniref:GAP family protein n=1 Tax=Agromyces cavernae TaxID=2898659 RepID=UPI001E5EE22F|nr:GAP family protein [Agromyces cavernae]MCD2441071.1 GAP family protein [Agromyces cavernae]
MGELITGLIPLALGILLSPLAYMALVAVLLSRLARVNGFAFLIGWSLGVVGVLTLSIWVFGLLDANPFGTPPPWVSIVRLVLGVFLVGAAVWVYRRGAVHMKQMSQAGSPREVAAAAPQLPGWLQAVDQFNPVQSVLLGLGIFVLNPVDATCAAIAGLDFVLADLPDAETVAIATGFAVLGILPIAIPVVLILLRGAKAQPFLDRTRQWIASHSGVLNAALLLVIGVLQLQKGVSGLI